MTNNYTATLTTKDIMTYDEAPQYDILWCDPPWEEKMQKFFHTQLYKDTKTISTTSHLDVLRKLAALADRDKPLYIEYSVTGSDQVRSVMEAAGHMFNASIVSHQVIGKPYILLSFNTTYIPPSDTKGWENLRQCLIHHYMAKNYYEPRADLPVVVFDPFAGIGNTAIEVLKLRCSYVGSELNPKRAAKGAQKIATFMRKK